MNMKTALDYFDHYEEGDIIICNDAYLTGPLCTHLPDVHILRPIFYEGKIVCWGYSFVHSSDIGGTVPVSVWPRATEIFQEGLRMRPIKLYRAGVLSEDVLHLILDNCRIPGDELGRHQVDVRIGQLVRPPRAGDDPQVRCPDRRRGDRRGA